MAKASTATVRRASHAGSWYSDDPNELNQELTNWLGQATYSHGPAKAIISPHAGYSYCGATAAYAFNHVNPAQVDTVFILGPSHHVYLNGCALTQTSEYETPLYNLTINQEINKELHSTGKFELMNRKTDEDEHSIEMQLSYVAKVMEARRGSFSVVPILVGSISGEKEKMYGQLLAKYFVSAGSLFVISSDFCHWGERFQYTYHDESRGEIWRSIEDLDKQGMDLIEKLNPVDFKMYLQRTENTICGRHPISVLLNIIDSLKGSPACELRFTRYAQSSRCKRSRDSSVSYASASCVLK